MIPAYLPYLLKPRGIKLGRASYQPALYFGRHPVFVSDRTFRSEKEAKGWAGERLERLRMVGRVVS